MNALWQDMRFGMRMILKNKIFSTTAVLILALGCGANTAIFSVLNAVILRPLPYSDPARLYEIAGSTPRGASGSSAGDIATWREKTRVFETIAAATAVNMILTGVSEPEQVFGLKVTQECFSMLGTPPALGRWFSREEFVPGAPRSVIIGYRLWQRDFAGSPEVLGRQITLNGDAYTVVAVMPPGFEFNARRCEFWLPLQFAAADLEQRDRRSFQAYARASRDRTPAQVRREGEEISRLLAHDFPRSHEGWRATVTPIQEALVAQARPTLLLILGAVACVLFIACINVANLLLARGMDRAQEIAVRIALGAGRIRIIRQFLTESFLLSLMGAALGLLIAAWANQGLIALFSQRAGLPRLEQTRIDGRVLAFALAISFLASVLSGLIPALQASRTDLNETLKETGRSGLGGRRRGRLRDLLIVTETALSIVLLAGAGLMLRSFSHLLHVNPGFSTNRLLTARLPMPAYRYSDKKQQTAYYTGLLEQIQSLPGVEAAGLVTVLPLSGAEATLTLVRDSDNGRREEGTYPFRAVSADYFKTMGIPILMGRGFAAADVTGTQRVAIVSEALARQLWPGQDPIGKKLQGGWALVVGMAGNVRHSKLSVPPQAELYMSYLQLLGSPMTTLVVRTRTDPMAMAAQVQKRIHNIEPDQPVADIRTMEDVVSGSLAQPRFYTLLLSIFAGIALVLASAGIYGVASYSVSQRQQEIGIRMTLGAQRLDILWQFVERGARRVLIGIGIGIAGALCVSRFLAGMLFDVRPADPATYVLVALLLLSWALIGMAIPALRAGRLDPVLALRGIDSRHRG